ncbi:MAG TPA: DinB family protein [Candidatus Sulfotelmatobacter sp.]|nr:DinB family protein [Candidatus Sulfotelmatobacter sp.]
MKKKKTEGRSEATRIADQLRRAFYGSAWHGPAVLELVKDIDAKAASAKPLDDVHSIWELLLHVEAWDRAGLIRLGGKKCQMKGTKNFPPVKMLTDAAWRQAVAQVKGTHDELVETVARIPESRLGDPVPGKRYDFYHMLHGIAQHELYHAGQLAILKKAGTGRAKR